MKKLIGVRLDEETLNSVDELLKLHKNSLPRVENFSDMLRFIIDVGINELKSKFYNTQAKESQLNEEFVNDVIQKVGRNEPCPCGSGKKYKHCCGK